MCLSTNTFAQNFTVSTSPDYHFSWGTAPVIISHFENVPKSHLKSSLKEVFGNYNTNITPTKDAEDEYEVSNFTLETNQKQSQAKIKLQEINGNTSMYTSFSNTESIISEEKTPNEINYYKDLVEIIAKKACSITFESLIDKQNEAIKSLNKELESIQKDEDKHHKNIGKYERDINLSKDKIENNKINLSSQDLLINKNNELLKNKEREIASKNVKSMTSNIKELEKSNKSLNKSIEKHQQKIAEINGQIAMDQSALKGNEAEINTLKNTINVDKEGRKILKKLNKENLKYIGSIETYKVSITDEENKIKELEIQKLNHQTEINNIKNNISIHNEDALINQLKLIEKEAKTLLATKKDIEKDIEKEYRSINQNSENIRLSKKEIEILKEKQITMKESISKSEMEFKELELQKKKFD
jgi:hypothetical protein